MTVSAEGTNGGWIVMPIGGIVFTLLGAALSWSLIHEIRALLRRRGEEEVDVVAPPAREGP